MKFLTKEGLAVGYSILYVRSGSEGFIDSRSQLHIVLIHTCVHTCGVGVLHACEPRTLFPACYSSSQNYTINCSIYQSDKF